MSVIRFRQTIIIFSLVITGSFCLYFSEASAAVDSDHDGFSDEDEIANGYSPFNPDPVLAEKSDVDADGLSDLMEWRFRTDPFKKDSDADGYADFQELDRGFDPLSSSTEKLANRIEIDLGKQELTYFLNDQAWRRYPVSTGKASMPTPTGEFAVVNKREKAWSSTYSLWMPYWLGLGNGSFGIHELPVWPNGFREGEEHLGKPVSHGCIRLGIGPAQYLYDRVGTGTKVLIKTK